MKQHEREFFISLVRSGKVFVSKNNIKLVIIPPTIDQSHQACEIYNEAYNQGYIDGLMNEEDMIVWMNDHNLWSDDQEKVLEGIKKDIEKLKIEIYNARNDSKLKERIRLYIRAGESQLISLLNKKNQYHQNTLEGNASSEKLSWIIKNTTFYKNSDKKYKFKELSLSYVVDEWQSSFLTESQSRELARSEPWKSLWTIKDSTKAPLFSNIDKYELTYNQKNLVIWSQMYDNIQESLECPPKDVIEDDDMLDGWFIVQAKKREKEKAEQELENNSKNEKIKNSSEIFVMAKEDKDAQRINSMNSSQSEMIKKQRAAMIKNRGKVSQSDFIDERLKIQMQQNNMFIGNMKKG